MTRTRIRWALILATVIAAGVLLLQARALLYPEPSATAEPAPFCDLGAGPCTMRFAAGGLVTLEVEPRGIPVARPLVLRVVIQGLEVSAAAVDFIGLDMNMGYNRPILTATGPGRYLGNAMLPICVTGRMRWEARVLLTTPRGLLAAPFRFVTST